MLTTEQIIEDVAQAVVKASSHWREDQKACWACAAQKETQESARWAMDNICSC